MIIQGAIMVRNGSKQQYQTSIKRGFCLELLISQWVRNFTIDFGDLPDADIILKQNKLNLSLVVYAIRAFPPL